MEGSDSGQGLGSRLALGIGAAAVAAVAALAGVRRGRWLVRPGARW